MLQGPGRLVQRLLLLSCSFGRLVVLPMVNVGKRMGLRELAAEERLAQRYSSQTTTTLRRQQQRMQGFARGKSSSQQLGATVRGGMMWDCRREDLCMYRHERVHGRREGS
jgi:hypothetical protein